ncbi:hypothetical protein D0T84_20695 [Dysgonomonas sp. 521]|uniref:hypothetical protein n=1 Tax=Dysgonomonas sp. 521 TaxID=2302932 RepID=UPI0013D569F8|nr:hypothetical protein [Dysgonomonas sp. 521]NDV97300.1 hypothetical protein [Dysgonomonas sp. 521]
MKIKDIYLYTERPISKEDSFFLEFFYYLSGVSIGQGHDGYAVEPIYVTLKDVKEIESWYRENKEKITLEHINKIFILMKEVDSIHKDIDGFENKYDSISYQLNCLRIK